MQDRPHQSASMDESNTGKLDIVEASEAQPVGDAPVDHGAYDLSPASLRVVKPRIAIAVVTFIGVSLEILACFALCYVFELGGLGGRGLESGLMVAGSIGVMLGCGTAAMVVCLLLRHWVVSLAAAVSIGIFSRLLWMATWPIAKRILESFDRYSLNSSTMYYGGDATAVEWSILCSIPPAIFVACIPLLLARAIRSWQLVDDVNTVEHRSSRMEDIFLTTAVVASMLVLMRVPSQLFGMNFFSAVAASLAMSVVLLVLGLAATIVTPIAFTHKHDKNRRRAGVIFLYVGGIALVLSVLLLTITGSSASVEVGQMFLTTAITATISATICLVGLRIAGLRLASVKTMRSSKQEAANDKEAEPIDVLADGSSHGDASEDRRAYWSNRVAAAGILAVSCVAGALASNVESSRQGRLQAWSEFATENAAKGAKVRIRENLLTGLVAGRDSTPEEIRPLLLPELETLSLRECAIDDTFLGEVASLPNLRELDLYGTNITGAGLQRLLSAGHRDFDYLGIGKTQVTAEELKRFLGSCTIDVLDLTDQGFSGEAIESLPRESIHGLVLSGNDISERWLSLYLGATASDDLVYLDVTGLPFEGEFLKSLGTVFLSSLVLDSTNVTDASLQAVARSQRLRTLSISETKITASGLSTLPSLTKLVIGDGAIKERQLGNIVGQTQVLKIDRPMMTCEDLNLGNSAGYTFAAGPYTLDLTGTALTDKGLKLLLRSGIGNFTNLRVANTKITDAGLSYFEGHSVYELDISNTNVTADGILAIPRFYGTVRVAPGQFSAIELGRIRSRVGSVEIGPEELIPAMVVRAN
ncbi:MAG: hypothetical protein Aurels2KO_00980 [Aureliella sp.]